MSNAIQKIIPRKWTQKEWDEFEKKLERLSLAELKELANTTGIKFFSSNVRKCDYINTLYESDKDELLAVYAKIVSRKRK